MNAGSLSLVTFAQDPGLTPMFRNFADAAWPTFLRNSNTRHWAVAIEKFPQFQFVLKDGQGEALAVGHAVPFHWKGTRDDLPMVFDGILDRAMAGLERGQAPNTLSALAAMVTPAARGRGLSSEVLGTMRALARAAGLSALVAPVRPTEKSRYPMIPMERYAYWTREDGSPFDPWIRVHWRLGAAILCVAPNAMTVTGPVHKWEEWTGMRMPASGEYIVPGGLCPVRVDLDRDQGIYVEPNVWMQHPVEGGPG